MAPKKKPITVGKGTGYTRPRSDPRPVSAKPSQAGRVRSAQRTTSSGITRRPDGRPQPEGRSGRQSISRAQVTQGSNGKPTGSAASRVTTGRGKTPLFNATKTLGTIRGMMTPVGMAAAVMAPRPLASGTLKGKATGPKQGPAVPKRLTQAGIDKQSFDAAFKASRNAGQKTFTWRGKKYNTKMKGE